MCGWLILLESLHQEASSYLTFYLILNMGDLKGDMRKAMAEVCKKEGLPPLIEKTIGSVWEHFKKSQPLVLAEKGLADEWKEKISVWELLQRSLEKYGVHPKIVELTMKKLKAKYGETPGEAQARLMVG